MEFFHPAMWHMALGSWHWIRRVAAPCNMARGSGMTCHWIRLVAAPCIVIRASGMTCHIIRPNVRHIGILLVVSISTISSQSTCYSAPVYEILSKSHRPRQKNKWRQDGGSPPSWILGSNSGFFEKPIGTIGNKDHSSKLLSFEKIAFSILATDKQTNKQTDKQMDSPNALSRSRCRERRLNKQTKATYNLLGRRNKHDVITQLFIERLETVTIRAMCYSFDGFSEIAMTISFFVQSRLEDYEEI